MSTSEAAEVYERHIKKLSPEDRRELVALIERELANECTTPRRHSLLELAGLGKEIWEGIDAQEYVNRVRDGRDLDFP